jgi:hypothetical protein
MLRPFVVTSACSATPRDKHFETAQQTGLPCHAVPVFSRGRQAKGLTRSRGEMQRPFVVTSACSATPRDKNFETAQQTGLPCHAVPVISRGRQARVSRGAAEKYNVCLRADLRVPRDSA